MSINWQNKNVLVTGGASFIGSHLVDRLVELEASVRVVDNLSSGKREHIDQHAPFSDYVPGKRFSEPGRVQFLEADLLNQDNAYISTIGANVIFHLAADHGGRGYVDTHASGPATNLALDGMLFKAAFENNVDKVVYASSGCTYPNYIQQDVDKELYLKEEDVGPPYDADNMYGWAKLMAEKTLEAYYKERGMKSASCRYFTVYGPRGKMNHAIIAMIGRAFLKQEPFKVWGDGSAIRNWTYVDDIVSGTIMAAEEIDDAEAINLGIQRRISVEEAANKIMDITGHEVEKKFLPNKPVGVLNRVCDNSRAKGLGWSPKTTFEDGLRKTIDWFYDYHDRDELAQQWGKDLLMER